MVFLKILRHKGHLSMVKNETNIHGPDTLSIQVFLISNLDIKIRDKKKYLNALHVMFSCP